MKGFKKDGKFRPTEKRTKSSLTKKDVRKKIEIVDMTKEPLVKNSEGKEELSANDKKKLKSFVEGTPQPTLPKRSKESLFAGSNAELLAEIEKNIAHDIEDITKRVRGAIDKVEVIQAGVPDMDSLDVEVHSKLGFLGDDLNDLESHGYDITSVTSKNNQVVLQMNIENGDKFDPDTLEGNGNREKKTLDSPSWHSLTKQQKQDEFEKVVLQGTHFNEDNEENWAKYNYGDTHFTNLPKSVQAELKKKGYTEYG